MLRNLSFLPIATALFFGLITQQASAISAEEFYAKCNSVHQAKDSETTQQSIHRALDTGSCSGYIGGVINGVNLVGNMLGSQGAVQKNFICLPEGKQAQELLVEVLQYIQANPTLSVAPAQLSIYNALSKHYPCKKFKQKN